MKITVEVEPLAAHVHVPPASPSFSHFTDRFIVISPSSTEDGKQRLFYTVEVGLASTLTSVGLLGLFGHLCPLVGDSSFVH